MGRRCYANCLVHSRLPIYLEDDSMNKPLSPAAQAVLTAQAKQRCLFEWSNVNDPPCHPSDPDWNGCVQCIDRHGVAATLRASAEQMPSDYPATMEQMPEGARRWYRLGFGAASNCDRSWLSAVATELEAPNA
jgi:hypothetical protein